MATTDVDAKSLEDGDNDFLSPRSKNIQTLHVRKDESEKDSDNDFQSPRSRIPRMLQVGKEASSDASQYDDSRRNAMYAGTSQHEGNEPDSKDGVESEEDPSDNVCGLQNADPPQAKEAPVTTPNVCEKMVTQSEEFTSPRAPDEPKLGQVFDTQEECAQYIKQYAARNMFSLRKDGGDRVNSKHVTVKYRCSRAGKHKKRTKVEKNLQRDSFSIRCGCMMQLSWRRNRVTGQCTISCVKLSHTNGCTPSKEQMQNPRKFSGCSEKSTMAKEAPTTTSNVCEKMDTHSEQLPSPLVPDQPQLGQVFDSQEECVQYIKHYAAKNMFSLRKDCGDRVNSKNVIVKYVCSRAGKHKKRTKVEEDLQRGSFSIRCGCMMRLSLKRNRVTGQCTFSFVRLAHTNGCTPSKEQLQHIRKVSGRSIKSIPRSLLHTIAGWIRGKSSNQQMRLMLQGHPEMPKDVVMDWVFFQNMRLYVKKHKIVSEWGTDPQKLAADFEYAAILEAQKEAGEPSSDGMEVEGAEFGVAAEHSSSSSGEKGTIRQASETHTQLKKRARKKTRKIYTREDVLAEATALANVMPQHTQLTEHVVKILRNVNEAILGDSVSAARYMATIAQALVAAPVTKKQAGSSSQRVEYAKAHSKRKAGWQTQTESVPHKMLPFKSTEKGDSGGGTLSFAHAANSEPPSSQGNANTAAEELAVSQRKKKRCTLCGGTAPGNKGHTRRKCVRLTKHAPERATWQELTGLENISMERMELVENFNVRLIETNVPSHYVKGLVVKRFFKIFNEGQYEKVCGIFGLDAEGKEIPGPVEPSFEPELTYVRLASVITYFEAKGLRGIQTRKIVLLAFKSI